MRVKSRTEPETGNRKTETNKQPGTGRESTFRYKKRFLIHAFIFISIENNKSERNIRVSRTVCVFCCLVFVLLFCWIAAPEMISQCMVIGL